MLNNILSILPIFSLIVALCSLSASVIVPLYMFKYTRESMRQQREHNINSVRPICHLSPSAIKDRVSLTFRNVGLGPMIITNVSVHSNRNINYVSLKVLLKAEYFNQFTALNNNPAARFITTWPSAGSAYRAGHDMKLFNLTQEENSDGTSFREARLKLLEMVSDIKIIIEYEDMYGNKQPSYIFPKNDARNLFRSVYESLRSEREE